MEKAKHIIKLLSVDRLSTAKIVDIVKCSSSTVNYHRKKLGLNPIDGKKHGIRHDWPAIIKFYNEGHSYRDCQIKFGVCGESMTRAVKRGLFTPRVNNKYLVFEEMKTRHTGKYGSGIRHHLRRKILIENLIPYFCAECGIDTWRGEKLTLRLDHKDGDGRNNELSNLRFVCPNCDSVSDTYCWKNRGRYD
jgi:hypothetical protein